MAKSRKQIEPVMAFASAHFDEDLSLATLAKKGELSPFHMHRVFTAAAGETPKQFALRIRLDRAASQLLASDDSVLNIALACGFQSHEVFCRAFRRQFGMTPGKYRSRGFTSSATNRQARQHASSVAAIAPCIRLFHPPLNVQLETNDMSNTITKRQIAPQHALVIRRRVKASEIANTLAEVLPAVFQYAQQKGVAMAGPPFTRYIEWGPGLLTLEAGMPTASLADSDGELLAMTLPGGPVAYTTHSGPYDKLAETHAAVQVWIQEQGLTVAGAPWESYITDPADYPDPKDWKTDVFWPLAG